MCIPYTRVWGVPTPGNCAWVYWKQGGGALCAFVRFRALFDFWKMCAFVRFRAPWRTRRKFFSSPGNVTFLLAPWCWPQLQTLLMDSNEPIFLDWLPAITNCPDLHGYARFCMGMRGFTWVCAELRGYAPSCTDMQIFVCVCAFNFFQTILMFLPFHCMPAVVNEGQNAQNQLFLAIIMQYYPLHTFLSKSEIFRNIFRNILKSFGIFQIILLFLSNTS